MRSKRLRATSVRQSWNNKSTKEAAPNVHLPIYIVADILSRLPVKSLKIAQCVCKLWYSLITHPYFIQMHFQESKKSPIYIMSLENWLFSNTEKPSNLLFFLKKCPNNRLIELCKPYEMGHGSIFIAGSCNGLICFLQRIEQVRNIGISHICICNPFTSDISYIEEQSMFCPFEIAFCCSASKKQYKIFQFSYLVEANYSSLLLEVYNLSTKTWTQKGMITLHVDRTEHIFVKGCLYYKATLEYLSLSLWILSIDATTEEVQAFPFSPDNDEFSHKTLLELDGQLAVCVRNELCMHIYCLANTEKLEWSHSYNVSMLLPILTSDNSLIQIFPISVKEGTILLKKGQRVLLFYDLRTNKIIKHSTLPQMKGQTYITSHVETLFPCKFFVFSQLYIYIYI